MTFRDFPTYCFLGMRIQPLTKVDLLNLIKRAIDSHADNWIIANHNLNSLYWLQRSPELQQFFSESQYTHVDGMPIILLGRLFGLPLLRAHRNTYLDWFDDFLLMAEQRAWRIFFLGGRPEVAAGVPTQLRRYYPKLEIRSHHGYDLSRESTSVYAEIRSFAPHVVLVGMGMPLQEKWILEARSRIQTNLFLPCGAAMDYYMHVQKAPPRWLGQIGLEWLYRFVSRPRELYSRYFIKPLTLLPYIVREVTARRFHIEERR